MDPGNPVHLLAQRASEFADYKVVDYSGNLPILLEDDKGFYPSSYGRPSEPHMGALHPSKINEEIQRISRTSERFVTGLPKFTERFSARAFLKGKTQTILELERFSDKSVKTTIYSERIFVDWVQSLKETEQSVYALLEYVQRRPWTKSTLAVRALKCFAFQFSTRRYEVTKGSFQSLNKTMKGRVFSFLRI